MKKILENIIPENSLAEELFSEASQQQREKNNSTDSKVDNKDESKNSPLWWLNS